jgi:hypothetical protein
MKTGGSISLTHTEWGGRRGYLRRGKRIRGERFESVRGHPGSFTQAELLTQEKSETALKRGGQCPDR